MTRRASNIVAAAALCGLVLLAAASASAQGNLGLVVRDGSIGPKLAPGDDGAVQPGGGFSYDITPDLGDMSGNNLFHSFSSFSIGSGESANFGANAGTANIISRVTGGMRSDLFGDLSSSSEANLFLLNPYGVVFGQDATVDVNGSFYVSTADQLNFEEGNPFLTRAATDPGGLSSAAPASFGFLTDEPAGITLGADGRAGVELCGGTPDCVGDGKVLSFVGGDIEVFGRESSSRETIEVDGGDIQLVSVAKAGVTVPIDGSQIDVESFAPDAFGEVRFANGVIVDANSDDTVGTGRIVIRGGRFVMEGGQLNASNTDEIDGRSVAFDVEVTNEIEIGKSAGGRPAVLFTRSTSTGSAGDVRLAGDRVTVKEGTRILTQTVGSATGPSVSIDANTIELLGEAGARVNTQILTRALNAETSDSGDIHLTGRSAGTQDRAESIDIRDGALVLTTANDASAGGTLEFRGDSFVLANGARIDSTLTGDASAGRIIVDAVDTTVAGEGSAIFSGAEGTQTGAKIDITADSLYVEDGGTIASIADDLGDGGGIEVVAANVTVTSNGAITSQNTGLGTGGAIDVTATQLAKVTDDGQISSTTESPATVDPASRRGGDVTIRGGRLEVTAGEDAVTVAQVSTITEADGKPDTDEGRGGDLTVDVDELRLTQGGQLRSITESSAPAGAMHVIADTIEIDGVVQDGDLPSGIFATSGSGPGTTATGAGGDLVVDARVLLITNGGEMLASTFGSGAGGDMDLTATERVTVQGNAGQKSVIASQGNSGEGGDITITTDIFELLDGGEVSVSTIDTADSGNARVNARTAVISGESVEERSGVFAQTNSGSSDAGNAGSIRMTVSESTVITNRGIVSSKSRGGGSAGDITFDGGGSLEVSDGGEISAVSEGFIPPSETVAAPGDAPDDLASDIRIVDASDVLVTRDGLITAQTFRNAPGGRIDVTAQNIRVVDGGIITAESRSSNSDAGAAGRIDLAAKQTLEILGSQVTTETVAGPGGRIRLSGKHQLTIGDESEASTKSTGDGSAGDILVDDTGKFVMKERSTMTAETSGAGAGGQIVFEKVDEVLVTGGSRITTKSSGEGAGDAGSIAIAARDEFQLEDGSEITTTADDAGGGRISIQAGKLVYLLDSKLETTVNGSNDVAEADAGDIDITFRGDEPTETSPETPEFVVINRSTVRANAVATDAGNISIAGSEVLISNDSVIEATSDTGLEGEIQITAPDADVVSQVTPLNTAFVDPGDRLLPPCVARTERTGSFIIQNHAATQPSPDSPLSPGLGTGADAGAAPFDAGDCPISQEES